MKQIIPIARDSIKVNPNAGDTYTYVSIEENIEFSYDRLEYDDFEKLQNLEIDRSNGIHIESYNLYESFVQLSGSLDHIQFLELLPKVKKGFNLKHNIKKQKIYHEPVPKYNYQHQDIELLCNNCNKMIKMSKIIENFDDEEKIALRFALNVEKRILLNINTKK